VSGSTVKHRIWTVAVAGALGGTAAAIVRSRRRRAARRRDAGEQAFYDASDGLWPPVRPASERVRIEADRADPEGSVGDNAPVSEAGSS